MDNRILKIIIFVSAAVGIIAYAASFFSAFPYLFSWANVSGQIFVLTSVYFLVKTGNFIRTKQFKIVGPAIASGILGVMFKIMHWPYADVLMMLGAGGTVLAYLWYVVEVQSLKTHALKLLFVCTFVGGIIIRVFHWSFGKFHWSYGKEVIIGSLVLLLLIVVPALRKIR